MRGFLSFAVGLRRALPALVLGCMASAVVAGPVPARYLDLIRHDRFADAEAQADADVAKIAADPRHKPEALCAALEMRVRVSAFDLYRALPVRLTQATQALECVERLPDSPEKALRVSLWKAIVASPTFSSGDRKRGAALLAETGPQIRQHRAHLPAVDFVLAATSLSNVASQAKNDFAGAQAWIEEALSAVGGSDTASRMIRTKLLALKCYRLGRLGRFVEGEAAGKMAVDLAAQAFGVPSAYHAYALQQLGEVQYFGHHLADAAVTIDQAVDDGRRLGASASDNLAVNLMIYANVQTDLGDYDRGRAALIEAIALQRHDESAGHGGNLSAMLSNLGMLEAASGHCEAALTPEREALQIFRQRYGEDNANLTAPLSVLGNCELETGQIDKARADYGQALSIAKKTLGEDNPQIAETYQEMALVDLADRDYTTATQRLQHALSRLPADTDTLGKQRIAIERNLARSLHAQHDDAAAFAHAIAGETVRQRLVQHFASALDESEALGARDTEHNNLDEILALAAARHDPAWIDRAWQLQIGARAQVTRLVAARLKAARASADPAMHLLWEHWKAADSAYSAALDDAEAGKPAAGLAAARDALAHAEQALGAHTHALPDAAPTDLAALRTALPQGGALIGFVRARSDAWENDYANVQHPQHYYAFRLDAATPIALVDLGDSRAIDAAVRDWTAALHDPGSALADVDALGADVTRRVWQPLGLADGLKRVFIVPEGELHRLAWLALPLRAGALAEKGPVPQLLDSERDVLAKPAAASASAPAASALLVGAVPPDPALATAACGGAAPDLPGARRELDALRNLWRQSAGTDAAYLTGNGASKAAVRAALAHNRIVHFATHAFSDDNDCMHTLLAARDVRLSNARRPKTMPALSGLLLAADAHATLPADRDGLLTAPQIATYELDGVDTVTLAACDTGSGTVHPDEGVFGLARAFRLAGARNVVMSLWSVDDEATADLMQRLYRGLLVEHAAPADALAAAARATLAARRTAGKSTHPYYWAAFVAAGDAR